MRLRMTGGGTSRSDLHFCQMTLLWILNCHESDVFHRTRGSCDARSICCRMATSNELHIEDAVDIPLGHLHLVVGGDS